VSAGEELLELAEQGDERAVKRAYARLLRQHRPDEDADAFQDLHACYQHALARCRDSTGSDDEPTVPSLAPQQSAPTLVEVAQPAHDALAAEPDPDGAALEIIQHATSASASSLLRLLQEQALGWSLRFRAQVGWKVLHHLHLECPPLSGENFDILAAAFDWEDVALDVDPLWLEGVARRCRQAWWLLPDSRGALRIAYEKCSERFLSAQETDDGVARLQQPRPRWRNRLDALIPTRARDTPYLLAALGYWPAEEVPAGLDAGQVAFWARFGDPADRVHVSYGAVRSGLVGLFLGLVTAWGVYASPAVSVSKGWLIIVTAALLVPGSWAVLRGFRRLLHWQVAEEEQARGPAWLRWMFLPAAAALVGALMWAQRVWGVEGLLLMTLDRAWAFGLALIATKRFHARSLDPHREPNAAALLVSVLWPMAGVGLSLVLWAIDLYRYRKEVRLTHR
jgi:hypothetical protein